MSDEIILKDVDYENETVTLGSEDNPCWTLAVGHIDAKEFDRRFVKEGWDTCLSENPDQEELDNAQKNLDHIKGYLCEKTNRWFFDEKAQTDPRAIDITVSQW